jgi:peroxiredoxin Q/BCP
MVSSEPQLPAPQSAPTPAPAATRELRVGDPAPDFSLPGSDARIYRLADYRGRQAVVLAWFAKAFTDG